MTGFYGVINGGMIGKSIVHKIGSSIDAMFVQGMFDVLIQRDIADAVGAIIGTLVCGLTPPYIALIFYEITKRFMKKSTKKFVETEENQPNETEEDEYYETESQFTKSKRNQKRSNKKKTNTKPKPNNKRQSYGTQNNQTRTETEWTDDELENAYKLLGVKYDATMDEIQSRYRRLTLKFHPDKGGSYDSWHKLGKALADIKKERNIPI